MAYDTSKLSLVGPSPFNGRIQLWAYDGTDAVGDVDASGYFSDGEAKGMKVKDFVLVRGANAAPAALMYVSDVTDGAATVVDITTA